jgi:hypothetical protein
VFQLSGQGVAVATLVAAEFLPALFLGPVAGVVIDRFCRKSILISADLIRAILVLSLHWPQGAWHAYLVAGGGQHLLQSHYASGHPGAGHRAASGR